MRLVLHKTNFCSQYAVLQICHSIYTTRVCIPSIMSGRGWIDHVFGEEGFPTEEWSKFSRDSCIKLKDMDVFKEAWMECGAYDPVNKIWSEEKMKTHLNELYRAECGLAKCVYRLRNA